MTSHESATEAAKAPARDGYAAYVLAILTIIYTFNFVDRQIVAILSPAIKEDLGLSDSALGLLKGFAFALFYTVLGMPIAWLADRRNRIGIISISLALWSAFTALSGLAANFTQLALARVGVGIGEAGCSPPAHSLISDYFPKEKRSGALGVYSLGIPFGQMLAFLAGGWVLENLGWRNAFFVVGVPGVALAIIMRLTIREPIRGQMDMGAASARPVAFMDGLRRLMTIPTYWGVIAGVTLASFTGYGVAFWVVDFFRRAYALSYTEITLPLGILNGVVYGVGTYLGGHLADRLGAKDKGAYAWLPALGMVATIPALALLLWAPTPFWSFFWSAPFLVGLGVYLGPSFSLVQTLAPVRLRAFATAFFFLILNIIGLGFAPFWVGVASDFFAASHGEAIGLKMALTTLAAPAVLSVIAFLWTARKLPADWEEAAGEMREAGQ